MENDNRHKHNFYGRHKGKTLKSKQVWRMENILPEIQIEILEGQPFDLRAQFGNANPIWIEIGFGGGEHLAHLAMSNPDINFVGCEPFVNGVAAILRPIEENNITNIRIFPGDARELFDVLEDGIFERAYLLYPDPWPKKRHADRRFMHPENLKQIHRLLTPNAQLRVASDIAAYIDHGLEAVSASECFALTPRDRFQPWDGWHRTRYESKAIRENRTPQYVIFERK